MSALTPYFIYLVEVESIASSIGSVLYGIYAVIAVLSLYSLASLGKELTFGRRFLFVVISIMLLFDTINTASGIYFVAHDIRTFGGTFHAEATRVLTLADSAFVKINYFLSDLVIVWRAWSIFEPKSSSIRLGLIFCVCVSLGAVFADIAIEIQSTQNLSSKFMMGLMLTRLILPCALWVTNTVATFLIALQTWKFHKLSKFENENRSIKLLTRVLLLMTESGFLYSLIWIVVIIDITGKLTYEAQYLLTNIIPHITGLYPCLMVLLVNFQKRRYDDMHLTTWSTSPHVSTV
ncbi:hypothetical protein BDP27DRAFT_1322921 [Rhodocollybia butyracea]|uniref:Uncharacterized protein n=1 Tax=Rhodocollybia butyracea TaxID=206335 RepID=A0A9P5PVY0_9AGAR|nr:hypothetical protein BDP27DRAFT_1322921 [Rhodocollybia butyracea]